MTPREIIYSALEPAAEPGRGLRFSKLPGVLLASTVLFLLAACGNLAGPEYERPEGPEKASWSESDAVEVSAAETIRPDWWSNFNDPYLDDLMAEAIDSNYDLKVLAARTGVAEAAISQVFKHGHPVELSPQGNYVRRLQHQLAERYGLPTESKGVEPYRRVVIYPL